MQQFDPTDYRGVYELYMRAYGNDRLARRAQSQAMDNYVNSKTAAAREKRAG